MHARWPAVLLSLAAFVTGTFLAAHHPILPGLAVAAFALWTAVAMRAPGLWLFVLPACLPVMNLAPWTGWIVFDEFDLVVLGALAGGCARLAIERIDTPRAPIPRQVVVLALLCAAGGSLAVVHGLAAAGGWSFDWHDSQADPSNALRVFKGPFYALLLVPLMHREAHRSPGDVTRRVAGGMVVGICIVVAAALWERAAYPGLLDFSDSYRTVALFWEMHVGGAAIDGYLAIAVPFVAWAVGSARTAPRWAAAAALSLLVEYTCLTTFSRGVYLAAAGSLLLLGIMLARRRPGATTPRWRSRANVALIAVMLVEALAIIGSDSFMVARMKRVTLDFGSRLAHWQNGLGLLHGPLEWGFGKGLGRLPAAYASSVPGRELSGSVRFVTAPGQRYATLTGAQRTELVAGLHAMTQRVRVEPGDAYEVRFDVRVDKPTRLHISLCEMHLLYEGLCQRGIVQVLPEGAAWQPVSLALQGPPLAASGWPPRMVVFAIALLDVAGQADLDNVVLRNAGGENLLRNADFSRHLAHWFPAAQRYFVPWHIDNLYLELLIEQGIAGLAVFAFLIGCALASLLSARNKGLPLSPFLVASLVGALLVGLVSSLLDVSRVGFLLYFLAFLSIQLSEARSASDER